MDLDKERPIDVLAFDLNSVVHTSLRKARDEEHAIALILKQLHAVQRSAPPARFVLLALDGAAPLAKVRTQRRRRQKSHARDARRVGEGRRSPRGLSSLLATPGTAFMSSLESALLYWSSAEALRRGVPRSPAGASMPPCRYFVSGADMPGEGELKILSWLMCRSRSASPAERVRSAVVVGGDGDLLIHALVLRQAVRWEKSPAELIHTDRGWRGRGRRGGGGRTRAGQPTAGGRGGAALQEMGRPTALHGAGLDVWVLRSAPESVRKYPVDGAAGEAGGRLSPARRRPAGSAAAATGPAGESGLVTAAAAVAQQRDSLPVVSVSKLGDALDREAARGAAWQASRAAAAGPAVEGEGMAAESGVAECVGAKADVPSATYAVHTGGQRDAGRRAVAGGDTSDSRLRAAQGAGLDLVVLTTLLGNDYLPKVCASPEIGHVSP